MVKTTLAIDAMACHMCESHVNDAIRNAFPVKKVASSFKKGTSEIVSEDALDEAGLRVAVERTGYRVLSVALEPFGKKRGLFS